MPTILDRYLVREIVPPFAIGLTVFTFILEIPVILREAEALVAKGVEWTVVAQVLLTLLPQALSITIPMAVLLGILVAVGRLSGDSELVALQACGVSLVHMLVPVGFVAVLGTAATAYEMIWALPEANQRFREIVYDILATRVERNLQPRTFFDDFPNRVLYVGDVASDGSWRQVFLSDTSDPQAVTAFVAREGRIVLDRERRLVHLRLVDATRHTSYPAEPDRYDGSLFEDVLITLDPATVFPRPPAKGAPEMSVGELRASIAEAEARGDPAYNQRFMIQQKLSIPVACPILAVIGLALGSQRRRDGKLASFVLGIGVVFVYYVLLWTARALALGGRLDPALAPWLPNIVLGLASVGLVAWTARATGGRIRPPRPVAPSGTEPLGAAPSPGPRLSEPAAARSARGRWMRPRLLDLYISKEYLRIFFLGVAAFMGLFYIARFMDVADKLFRGSATTSALVRHYYYQTPQFVLYIVPIAVLLATLVTIGVMTKNSELVVMRACGVSLYRTAVPLVMFAVVASVALFGLQETILADFNREADRLDRQIRGYPPATSTATRTWIAGPNGDVYHFDFYDRSNRTFRRLWLYQFGSADWRLETLTFADTVSTVIEAADAAESAPVTWLAKNGWQRRLSPNRVERSRDTYLPFAVQEVPLAPPDVFERDEPAVDQMTYRQLSQYVELLRSTGARADPFIVAQHRRLAFPLVTVVMTILAIPFAVTTGRHGAMYGIGIGIVLAMIYWTAVSISAAMGAGGLLPPVLAAWAPNTLFAAVAAYGVLTVRT